MSRTNGLALFRTLCNDIVGHTVTAPLVRNVDGERSEGCCHLANG